MNHLPKAFRIFLSISIVFVSLSLLVLPTQTARALETPEQIIQRAWQRAQEIGIYQFSSDLIQTKYPAPALANFGRTSQKEFAYLKGTVNLPEQSMNLSLWHGEGSVASPQSSIEIRIVGNRGYARQYGGPWHESDDLAGGLAPDNDFLAYLAGIKNVSYLESILNTDRYGFELDGPVFAEYMRTQLEEV